MADPLTQVPANSNLYIDANIFVYATTGASAECVGLLQRCSTEEVTGICLYETVHEVVHQLMLAEARGRGLLPNNGPTKWLGNNPAVIRSLASYWTKTLQILSLNLLFLSSDEAIVRQAQAERATAGLLTNDSLIASCMGIYGIRHLATLDRDFDRVAGIRLFRPTDLP